MQAQIDELAHMWCDLCNEKQASHIIRFEGITIHACDACYDLQDRKK